MKVLLVTIAILALISSVALADYRCPNITHSEYSTNIKIGTGDLPISFNKSCQFNCTNVTGQCNLNPYEVSTVNLIVAFVLPLLSFILIYIATKMKNPAFTFINILLFGMSLLFIVADGSYILQLTENSNQPTGMLTGIYSSLITGAQLVFFIILLFFFYNLIKQWKEASKLRKSKWG